MGKKTAFIISRVFEPFVLALVLVVIPILRSSFTPHAKIMVILIAVFGMILPPLVLFIIGIRNGVISSIEVSNREERPRLFAYLCIFLLIDYGIVWLLGDAGLIRLFTSVLVWFLGVALISNWYKISIHAGFSAFAALTFVSWYGSVAYPVLMVPLLVAVARVALKAHTVGQVVSGIVYSIFFTLLTLTF